MAGSSSPSPKPSRHEQRFNERRQEYQDYLPLTERLEEQLRGDVEELMAQEGWDAETRNGVEEWLRDKDNVWRALRRYRYDENKAHALLLSDLAERVNRQLHKPIPLTDLTNSPLFFVLPLPRFVDRLGRPVVVLTLSEVARDENGSLEDVKEWTWWALEKLRRTVHDWWAKGAWSDGGARARKARGYGGEGCVVLVNAAGAGYRNLEVELLPTLLSVGHNHFPGIIEAVYVVNAKWTHRSMWSVVKQVMPRTALDKFAFLDDPSAIKEVFDLERLPTAYGGRHPWTFGTSENAILLHYAHQPIPTPKPPSPSPISSPSAVETPNDPSHASPARTASYTSIADVYYSAQNSPGQSRQASRRGSTSGGPSLPQGLRMTGVTDGTVLQRSRSTTAINPRPTMTRTPSGPPSPSHSEHVGEAALGREEEKEEKVTSPFEEQFARGRSRASSRKSSRRSSPRSTPLQRIKSLSNFHLYLSPSRLAPPALLSDSEDDMPPLPPPRKVLRPVVMDPEATIRAKTPTPQTLAERRARPGLNIHGIPAHMTGDETVRTYSDRLQLHHAKAMQAYRSASQQPEPTQRSDSDVTPKAVNPVPVPVHVPGPSIESPGLEPSPTPSPPSSASPVPPQGFSMPGVEAAPGSGSGPSADSGALMSAAQPVSAFSSTNPWFGYPAERVPDSSQPGLTVLRPRYPRNRKRDLVKTLLFLFMLRLQAWRDAFERLLGLNHLRTWTASTAQLGRTKALTPDEGLVRTAQVKRAGAGDAIMRSGYWERDWVWMVIGFLLLRGTWTRILSAPLEAVGLESVRDMLGLV